MPGGVVSRRVSGKTSHPIPGVGGWEAGVAGELVDHSSDFFGRQCIAQADGHGDAQFVVLATAAATLLVASGAGIIAVNAGLALPH